MAKPQVIKLVFLALFFSAGTVYAEGGTCPDGYYPANAPGVMGCAPIPDYDDGGNASSAAARTAWADRWGAIATDGPNAILGSATGMSSRRKAEKAALSECGAKGGNNCKIDLAFHNQCAVLVTGDIGHLIQSAATVEEATRLGVEKCNESDANCRAFFSACSLPEVVRVN